MALELPETDDYTFSQWLDSTRRLQEEAYGSYYELFTDEERADSLMMNLLAAIDEISELGGECGWKPWTSPRGWTNREGMIKEAVDALHFIGNLLTHAQCTGAELTAAYKAKQLKNLRRQLEGYDGVASKCPSCHRELEDAGVNVHEHHDMQVTITTCKGCGHELSRETFEERDRRLMRA